MRGLVLIAVLASIGCNGDDDDTGIGPDDNVCGLVDDPNDLVPATPDDVDFDPNCEDVDGTEVPGATSYFLVDYLFECDETEGEVVAAGGSLTWVLIANSRWKESPDWDPLGSADYCQIVWNVYGGFMTDDPPECSTCAYSVEVDLGLDSSATNCPEGLYDGLQEVSDVLDIRILTDGSTEVFGPSGTLLGTGDVNDQRATAVIGPQCKWF